MFGATSPALLAAGKIQKPDIGSDLLYQPQLGADFSIYPSSTDQGNFRLAFVNRGKLQRHGPLFPVRRFPTSSPGRALDSKTLHVHTYSQPEKG